MVRKNEEKLKEFLELYWEEDQRVAKEKYKEHEGKFAYTGIDISKDLFVREFMGNFNDIVDRFLEDLIDKLSYDDQPLPTFSKEHRKYCEDYTCPCRSV